VGDKLKELKNIIIKYCPDSADINLLNDALYDIYRCEQELESHCMEEDRIFVPAVVKLERKVREDVQR
jgi:regulator of cell morphogenesis and NO signaling